jgi:hypothetical protein
MGSDSINDCVPCVGLTTGGKNCDGVNYVVPISCLEGYVLNNNVNPHVCVKCIISNCDICSLNDPNEDCNSCKSGYTLTIKNGANPATCTKNCSLAGCDSCSKITGTEICS